MHLPDSRSVSMLAAKVLPSSSHALEDIRCDWAVWGCIGLSSARMLGGLAGVRQLCDLRKIFLVQVGDNIRPKGLGGVD